MEYFGGLSDLISPRDIVVGTAPDSLLTLVSQDLPEDIFDHDEDEETDEDGGGSDLHAADAIDAVMDSNNADINLASVIDDLDASFVDALAERYHTYITNILKRLILIAIANVCQ